MPRSMSVSVGRPPEPPPSGLTEPTWTNVGYQGPLAALTKDSTVNFVTSYAGQVIDRLWLPFGRIEVRHPGVKIRRCVINVGWSASRPTIHDNPGITGNPDAYDIRGLVVEDTTIDPILAGVNGGPNDYSTYGIFGTGTFSRVAIRNVTDAFAQAVGTVSPAEGQTIVDSFARCVYRDYDAHQTDGTHNDLCQLSAGSGHLLQNVAGEAVDANGAAVAKGQFLVATPYKGFISDVTVKDSWITNFYTQISLWPRTSEPNGNPPDVPRSVLTGNRHRGTCVWPILMSTESYASRTLVSGNVAGAGGCTWNNGTTAAGTVIAPKVAAAIA